jgi:X-X-X-Leu-X-X-Gly heptad repeat protein
MEVVMMQVDHGPLLEQIESQLRLLAEAVTHLGEKQDQHTEVLQRQFAEMNARVVGVESNVSELKTGVSELKSGVSELTSDVSDIRKQLVAHEVRFDRIDERLDRLEYRRRDPVH